MQNLSNYGATLAEAEQHLRNCEPFHTGTFSAEWYWLGQNYSYIVKSYGETIAIHHEATWVGGEDFYRITSDAYSHSKTTSKHANLVKKAWGI